MAKVYHAICLKTVTYEDPDTKAQLTLHRGQEYTVGQPKDGKILVFSTYWVTVEAELFAGLEPLGLKER